ncbi:MAG: HEAT repeat domain-containing protein [Terriglobales bacterium]
MNGLTECERAAGLLAGTGSEDEQQWMREHLAACTECSEMAGLWERMGALPEAAPDPRQRVRFNEMLAAYAGGLEERGAGADARLPRRTGRGLSWLRQPMPAMAAAALLVAGLVGGWFLRSARAPGATTSQQIAELRGEVQNTRQIAVLSLLQQQSPSDRLQGVSYSTGLIASDPRVMAALLRSLKYDPSPGVRLAALDALTRHAAEPAIQQGLVDAFGYQKSPLLQVAMVDSFVETANPKARTLLQAVSKNKNYNAEVRKRAAWGLAQPQWN